MEKLINDFLEALRVDGKSEHTIIAYRSDLSEFAIYFGGQQITDIKYPDLRLWANAMESKGLVASSRARKVATVKSFFRYLVKMGVIEYSSAESLDAPKQEVKVPQVISTDNASEILFLARNEGGRDILWFRDYAIMAVFLFTGIRREELINISLAGIDLLNDTILIHGKGSKQRKVFISPMLHAILSEYIMCYREKMPKAKNSSYLFPSLKAKKMCTASVNNVVNRYFEKIGIKTDGISVHALRKRFATSAFEATQDIATVSKLLGHSSPTVTMRYIAMNEDTMRSATNCVNY